MRRRLSVALVYAFCVASITVSAQSQASAPTRSQPLVLEISIVELIGAQPDEIERIGTNRDDLTRLINAGKAKRTATLQVHTRVGESFRAWVGQRLPIQSAFFPAFRAMDDGGRGTSQTLPPNTAFGIPQLQYQSTGLSVEGTSVAVDSASLDIRFTIEMSGLDTSTGKLTPTFTTRSLTSVVRMKQGETSTPMVLIQQEPAPASGPETTAVGPDLPRGSFIILLTTKPGQ